MSVSSNAWWSTPNKAPFQLPTGTTVMPPGTPYNPLLNQIGWINTSQGPQVDWTAGFSVPGGPLNLNWGGGTSPYTAEQIARNWRGQDQTPAANQTAPTPQAPAAGVASTSPNRGTAPAPPMWSAAPTGPRLGAAPTALAQVAAPMAAQMSAVAMPTLAAPQVVAPNPIQAAINRQAVTPTGPTPVDQSMQAGVSSDDQMRRQRLGGTFGYGR